MMMTIASSANGSLLDSLTDIVNSQVWLS